MRKNIRILTLLAGMVVLAVGCGKEGNAVKTDNPLKQGEHLNFAADYSQQFEKVQFQCRLEIPESFNNQKVLGIRVKEQHFVDQEKAYSVFIDGKTVSEKHTNEVDKGMPEENIYILEDGTSIGIGSSFSFNSMNAKYYLNVGASDSNNKSQYEDKQVAFSSAQECVEKVKDELKELGYPVENFEFSSYPLNAEMLKNEEAKYLLEGMLKNNETKPEWSEEDDAYFVYAYQKQEQIPVFHELMSIARQLAYDTADNAPVQVIYSARGLESLIVSSIYDFETTDKPVEFKAFDEIASVVAEKYNSVLNDASYVVNRAKLYDMVNLNEKQKYEAKPIWYFEIMENGESKSVTLVDAVTGKEIYLK